MKVIIRDIKTHDEIAIFSDVENVVRAVVDGAILVEMPDKNIIFPIPQDRCVEIIKTR